jgi:hypothetical protein
MRLTLSTRVLEIHLDDPACPSACSSVRLRRRNAVAACWINCVLFLVLIRDLVAVEQFERVPVCQLREARPQSVPERA